MCPDATNAVPSILQPLSNDEYVPPPRTQVQKQVVEATAEASVEASRRLATTLRSYVASQRGTAAGSSPSRPRTTTSAGPTRS